ncbi:transposase [Halalkalibacter krulwichiae]|uniref:Uncharacterized protein n=1 Tax=Halalkalibacter krulwichiae TaxID=199441 RepID=A0A1X9M846_9BACI|nr:transposase [Halalkalibacter krulwichiae]ARK29598.1 hypothetical protein BkAM31D_06835 [Halalkalibacter krulwichiae]
MKSIFAILIVVIPLMMWVIERKWIRARTLFNVLAYFSTIIFGYIITTTIYEVLSLQEVFMTSIHGILLNQLFLVTGAYIGSYFLYRIVIVTLHDF